MQAIILAGGFGTRLREVVNDRPKPMADINGKPFLSYLLDKLDLEGFNKVVFAVGYMHEYIENYYKDKYKNINIVYSLEDEPLGTGGCIKKALSLIDEEECYVLNGDTFFDIDLREIEHDADVTIACRYFKNFSRYGKVEIDDNRNILSFNEKAPNQTGYINGGIYLFKKNVFDKFILPAKFSLESDFFTKYINELTIKAFKSSDYFMDIGIPEDYFQFAKDIKKEKVLFLDRDGVINIDYGHVHSIDKFDFTSNIFDIARKYQSDGFKIIVVSNQAGIAKGMYTKEDLNILDKYMKDEFKKNGIEILDSFYCPHREEDNCSCRKPKPGLILQACAKYDIDLSRSVLIGDKSSDLEAGHNAGITKLFFKKGRYEIKAEDFDFTVID
ncbi:MAG: D-glycero-beta-D-manno-heptose 1,7-bisphosphate 7-phosphatase [Acholeplasmatales bacterium]|nr:D-glycero-beta-D-manno-heptose 1,7-bisphosphate 7-phosphatase [Acholeplasmatales bacterium]